MLRPPPVRLLRPRLAMLSLPGRACSTASTPSLRKFDTLQSDTFAEREYRVKLKASCDGSMSEEVMGAYVKAIFDDSDTGGSGQLSLSELSTAIGIMRGRCPISRLALDTDSAVRHYEKADTNRDGVVSFAEFKEYLREHVLRTMYARNLDAEAEERRQQACALSRTPLLEARVQELVPGIDERGMHENRLLLFGGAKPAADAVLLRSNDYLQLGGHDEIAAAKAEALLHEAPGCTSRRSNLASALLSPEAAARSPVDYCSWDADCSSGARPTPGPLSERRARVFTLDEPDRHRAFERRMASLLGAQDAVLTMALTRGATMCPAAHSVPGAHLPLRTACAAGADDVGRACRARAARDSVPHAHPHLRRPTLLDNWFAAAQPRREVSICRRRSNSGLFASVHVPLIVSSSWQRHALPAQRYERAALARGRGVRRHRRRRRLRPRRRREVIGGGGRGGGDGVCAGRGRDPFVWVRGRRSGRQ